SPVDGAGYQSPAVNLLLGVDTGSSDVADPLRAYLSGFGDDQPRRGPLGIVGGCQWVRNVTIKGTAAGHGGHHHTVGEFEAVQAIGREKVHWLSFHQAPEKGLSMM